MKNIPSAFRLLGVGAVTVACTLFCAAARADISSPVTVQLVAPGGILGDPTPLDLVQQLSAGMANQMNSSGSGQISAYMQTNDSITLIGDEIQLSIASGGQEGLNVVTGYLGSGAQHAYYEFDDLDIGAPIAGFTASDLQGLISPTSASDFIQLTGSTLTVDLDNLVFSTPAGGGAGDDFATVDITLNAAASSPTNPGNPPANGAPEPGSLACLAAAGLGLLLARRRLRVRPPSSDLRQALND